MFTVSSPRPRSVRVPLLLTILSAFALRVVALDRLGIAYDEAASALMARATPAEIIAFHWQAAFEHPPVWVLLLHYWSKLAGQSEVALRLMPAYAGLLIVPLVWRLARLVWPRATVLALLTAIAVALSPVLVYYAQEARMYTLVVALMLLAIYHVLRLRVAPTGWRVGAFWLTCWLMLGLHYYAALGLAIQAGVLLLEGLLLLRRRDHAMAFPWRHLSAAFVGALLPVALWMLFAPGFHTTLKVVLEKAGENPVTWQYFLGDLWRELTIGSIRFQPDFAAWGYTLAPLVAVGAVWALFAPPAPPPAPMPSRLGTWLIIALVALPILSGALALRTLVPRYILWIVPLFYLLAAVPAAKLWRWQWWAGLALFLLIAGVEVAALQYYLGPYRKSDFRDMTTYLAQQGNPQRELLLIEAPRQHLLIKYYLDDAWQVHPMPSLPLPDYWPVTAPLLVPEDEDDRLQAWLADQDALWVSYSSEAEVDRGEFLAKYLTAVAYRERCTQWLDARLCHYVSPHHLTPVTLEPPALRTGPLLFGSELALTGASVATYTPDHAPASLLVQLEWHAQQQPSLDYKVALRLVAPDGSVVDEWNDFPIGALLPPTTWQAGDRKPGYMALRLPPDLPSGRYVIQFLLYDPATLAPTVYTTAAQAASTEPYTLVEVVVAGQVDDTMHPNLTFDQPATP